MEIALSHSPRTTHLASAASAAKRRRIRIWLILIVVAIAGLVAFRLYLPTLILNKTNATLAKLRGYDGHIDSVDIRLWRGAYAIHGLELLKQNGDVPVPFVRVESIDFSLAWIPLFHGNLSGKVEMEQPTINFVIGDTPAEGQLTIDDSWQDRVKELFPLRISRLGVKKGEIHFRNFHADPPIDLLIHHIVLLATNLTNSRKLSNTLKATIDGDGVVMSDGDIHLHMVVDPLGSGKTFNMEFELKHLPLPELNNFFKHYLAVNMRRGTLSLYMEGAAENNKFAGYVKTLLEHPDLVNIKEDATFGEFFKGFAVKMVSYLLKNHAKDRLATRIEVSGNLNHPEVNIWVAVASFLRNWLIKAIAPGIEGTVTLKNAREQTVPSAPRQKG